MNELLVISEVKSTVSLGYLYDELVYKFNCSESEAEQFPRLNGLY